MKDIVRYSVNYGHNDLRGNLKAFNRGIRISDFNTARFLSYDEIESIKLASGKSLKIMTKNNDELEFNDCYLDTSYQMTDLKDLQLYIELKMKIFDKEEYLFSIIEDYKRNLHFIDYDVYVDRIEYYKKNDLQFTIYFKDIVDNFCSTNLLKIRDEINTINSMKDNYIVNAFRDIIE